MEFFCQEKSERKQQFLLKCNFIALKKIITHAQKKLKEKKS